MFIKDIQEKKKKRDSRGLFFDFRVHYFKIRNYSYFASP